MPTSTCSLGPGLQEFDKKANNAAYNPNYKTNVWDHNDTNKWLNK